MVTPKAVMAASGCVPRPFSIRVPEEELADLRLRLKSTRWPANNIPNEDWAYGAVGTSSSSNV